MPPIFNVKAYYQNLARTFRQGPSVPHRVSAKMAGPGEFIGSPIGTAAAFLRDSTNTFANHMSHYGNYSRLSRYADYSEMETMAEVASALDIYCLAGNTVVPLLNGQDRTIQQLYKSQAKNFYVYSYDVTTKKMVPGLCKKVMLTGRHQQLYRVNFDDGTFVRLTANHKILLKSGDYVRVADLVPGDSIASLYAKQSSIKDNDRIDDYEMILQEDKSWEYTHRLIGEATQPNGRGVIHHKDFCKWNNDPSNLQFMTWKAHQDLHAKSNTQRWQQNPRYAKKMAGIFSEHAKRMWADPEWAAWKRQHHSQAMIEHYKNPEARKAVSRKGKEHGSYKNAVNDELLLEQASTFERLDRFCEHFDFGDVKFSKPRYAHQFVRRRLALYGYASWGEFKQNYRSVNNHKVLSVVCDAKEDVFDLEVEHWHNFAIGKRGNCVFVHNSHETCAKGEYGEILKIESNNAQIKDALTKLFYETLNIEFNLAPWVRSLCKYGDYMLLLDHHPEFGVMNMFPMPVNEVEREEGFDPENPMRYRYRWISHGNKILEPWQVIHFRLLGNDSYLPYGMSILEAGRRAWRQLVLMEDAVMVYRIVRSPERRVFYIDVGNVAPQDVGAVLEKAKNNMKRNQVVDPNSGQVDLRYNALPVHWSTPIPLLDGRTISIKELAEEYKQGKENWVYSTQDQTNGIVPGKVAWCGKNYRAKKLVKVSFDEGGFVLTAPEHPFILRNGSKVRADLLKPDDKLMPFYRKLTQYGYEMVYDPGTRRYRHTHRVIAESAFPEDYVGVKQPVVHHKQFWLGEPNKTDNRPPNLQVMEAQAHNKGHSGFNDFRSYAMQMSHYKNHRVSTVETIDADDDVYCMTVIGPNGEQDRHNFAVLSKDENGLKCTSGVLVSNSVDEDFYIGVRGTETGTRIDTLPGGQYVGQIDDLHYIQNKLFAALKIPKSYLGYDGDVSGRSTLSQEDVRFARTIQHIQRVVLAELEKIAMIQLYSMGLRDEDTADFELSMANPSTINEIQRLELWRTRFEVASLATGQDGVLDKAFLYRHIFKLSDQDIESIELGRERDKKFQVGLDGLENTEQSPDPEPPQPDPGDMDIYSQTDGPMGTGSIDPVGEGIHPNQQRAAPNAMLGKGYKKKKKRDSEVKRVYNMKKNGMDPLKSLQLLRRTATSPWAEADARAEKDAIFEKRVGMLGRHSKLIDSLEAMSKAAKNKKIL